MIKKTNDSPEEVPGPMFHLKGGACINENWHKLMDYDYGTATSPEEKGA
jgi:hypothetical protein